MPVIVYNEAGEALKEISAFIDQSGNRRRVKNIFVADEITGIYKPVYQYEWSTSEWGACSASCGGGTQTRDVFCLRHDGVALPDVYCDEAGDKPEASMICNLQPCQYPIQNISVTTPRHSTYDRYHTVFTFSNQSDLLLSRLYIDRVEVSDICGRPYVFSIYVGGTIIYSLNYRTSWSAPIMDYTGASICSRWNRSRALTGRLIPIPADLKKIGNAIQFRIYLIGGDDCCKGMYVSNNKII